MGQRAAQPVQLVHDQPLDLPSSDVLHEPIKLGPGRLGSANSVNVEGQVFPAALAAVARQFHFLAVGSLIVSAESDIDGVHKTTVNGSAMALPKPPMKMAVS